jgi:hypothetical protein
MASRILSVLMILLGVSAILIGLSVFLAGAAQTGGMTAQLFDQLTGHAHGRSGLTGPTIDSELRFYAPFWIVYGAVLIATARNLGAHLGRVPGLAALFFAGGVGRALAWLQSGPPHPAFVMLMATELGLPIVFLALWALAKG